MCLGTDNNIIIKGRQFDIDSFKCEETSGSVIVDVGHNV